MRTILSPYLVLLFIIVCPMYATSAGTAVDSVRQKTITDDQQHDVGVNLRREFVYGLTLFDGAKYQGTFSPGEIETIYMIAGVNNVISARTPYVRIVVTGLREKYIEINLGGAWQESGKIQ